MPGPGAANSKETLEPNLEPLRPLLGKTWRGEFAASTPEKPVVDIMYWERALNGAAVRVLHSINHGEYGGETIYRWDAAKNALTYYYFTTAGFMTTGTVQIEAGMLVTHEVVIGEAGGASEVRAVSGLLADGTFQVKSEYKVQGAWRPARQTIYTESPGAEVVFC